MKSTLPSWGVVEVVVEQLAHQARPRLAAESEVNRFKTLWDEAHASLSGGSQPADSPTPQSASEDELPSETVRPTFVPSAFTSRNGLIHQAIMDLHEAGKPVGVPQVAAELERRGQLEFCGGEDYLFECVKVAIKGAYEARMSIPEFAALNARKVRAAADAREELMASVFDPSNAERLGRAIDRVTETHPHWARQQAGKAPSS
ncbi:DnaB-like helicase N-terminal domain-containing protein [Streptomyces sp. NPDC001922]|uniref:DnaB-like helicase N-terminal domain-containing protein n=1 Tax=Streptomyces sp. NPDC001922 TaxID=3364624 RepID=UPI00369A78E9